MPLPTLGVHKMCELRLFSIHVLSCIFLFLFSMPFVAFCGENAYVTDVLYVSMRSEPSISSKRLKMIHSNQQLEILETEGGFSRVRTVDGSEGWVQKQYISTRIPKSQQLNKSKLALEQLKKEKILLEIKLSELKKNSDKASEVLGESDLIQGYKKQLMALQETNKRLAGEIAAQKKENILLKGHVNKGRNNDGSASPEQAEFYRERQSGRIQWFLAGCFVFFFGWIIGRLSAGRTKRKGLSF